jgi:hypothetical protein
MLESFCQRCEIQESKWQRDTSTCGVSRVDLGERRSSPTCRRELQRRRPTPCRSGASKGWARNPAPSSSSLWPDPAQPDHTPSRSREWCIAAKLACRMSRRHPPTSLKAVSALHTRFLGNCLPASFTGDARSTPADRRRRRPSVQSGWQSRPGIGGSDGPTHATPRADLSKAGRAAAGSLARGKRSPRTSSPTSMLFGKSTG